MEKLGNGGQGFNDIFGWTGDSGSGGNLGERGYRGLDFEGFKEFFEGAMLTASVAMKVIGVDSTRRFGFGVEGAEDEINVSCFLHGDLIFLQNIQDIHVLSK
ncbi:MAG: hypothetical protein QW356_00995 [Candidatus Hadarchaeales archaeon]